MTALDEQIRLRADAQVKGVAAGEARVTVGSGRGVSFGRLTSRQHAALCALGSTGLDLSQPAALEGPDDVRGLIETLRAGNWLRVGLRSGGRLLAEVVPGTAPGAAVHPWQQAPFPAGVAQDDDLVLSRFALLRRVGTDLVVESPQARATLRIPVPEPAELLVRLARPLRRTEAVGIGPWAPSLLDVLVREGLVVPARSGEDSEFHRLQWAPHELWFHVSSAMPGGGVEQPGGAGTGWGGTAWAEGRFPAPAARGAGGGSSEGGVGSASIKLPTPDLGSPGAQDPTFTEVLETRRSLRRHDDTDPLGVAQLGEFLFRTARTRSVRKPGVIELVDRPYPSGGGLHELQLYLVAAAVSGLEPGMYRYDGWDHALEPVAPFDAAARLMARQAAASIGMTGLPQAVFVISARFGRTMWKYQSMAYALVLKNVGVLMGSMYLVAAAMRLAPCAVGAGDAEQFARVTGLDPLIESMVGAFTLGSAPPDAYPARDRLRGE
jgi:SagB-type dehydrogenase family enzyme